MPTRTMLPKRNAFQVSLRALVFLFAVCPLVAWFWWQLPFETESVITTPPEAAPTVPLAPSGYYRRQVVTVRRGLGNRLIRHGPLREYDRKGRLLLESHWQDGRLHGAYRLWAGDGELLAEGGYLHGEPHGDWRFTEPAQTRTFGGQKISVRERRSRCESYDNGRPVGVWTENVVDAKGSPRARTTRHHDAGVLTCVEHARFGSRSPATQATTPPIVSTRIEYYDMSGTKRREQQWHGGREWLVSDATYEGNVQHGASKHLYPDGQSWIVGQWLHGRPHGVWQWRNHATNSPDARTWRTPDGKEFQARLVMATRNTVRLEMPNGIRDVPLDRLCDHDQQFVMGAIDKSTSRGPVNFELEFDNGVLIRRDKEPVADYPLLDFQAAGQVDYKEALGQAVTLKFKNEPLVNVVVFLSDYLGVPIIVHDPSHSRPITVDLAEIPAAAGLYLMLEPHGLSFSLRHDVLLIATAEELRRDDLTGVGKLAPSGGSPWERALTEPAAIQANAVPLDQVVTQLAATHGVRISMSEPVLQRARAGKLDVTFTISGVSLRSALGLLLEHMELTCRLTQERVIGDRPSEVLLVDDRSEE